MDFLSTAASTIAVVSIAMQATDSLRELQSYISGFENNSERIKSLLKETITLSMAFSEVVAANANSRALKHDTEKSGEVLRAYNSVLELLQNLLKNIIEQKTRFSGKGKEGHADIKFWKDYELRQYEADLEKLKQLCLVAHQYYSLTLSLNFEQPMPLMLDVTAPNINKETTSKSKPRVLDSSSMAEWLPDPAFTSVYLTKSSQYLVPIKDSVFEIRDLIKVLKCNSEKYRRAIGQLEVIMRKTDRIEGFMIKENELDPAYRRADETLSFCSNQLRSLSAMMMATRQQLTLDEETVISPAYISAKLDQAISTLSTANIGDTQLEQSTKRYNLLGGRIAISWRYQNISSPQPPPTLRRIESANPHIIVKVNKGRLKRRSTIITLRIHLPWREFSNSLSLHFSETSRGHSFDNIGTRSFSIRTSHVVPYDDPSIRACQSGDLAKLEHILVSRGYDGDITDPDRRSLLHYGAANLHHNICRFLIKTGVQINAVDAIQQQTVLHVLALRSAYISSHQEKEWKAILASLVEQASEELSPTAQDEAGQTFFHLYRGSPENYLWMLEKFPNENMDIKDSIGCRPLHSVLANLLAPVSSLVQRGEPTERKPEDKRELSKYKDYYLWREIIRYLVKSGVDIHAITGGGAEGKTPLDFILAAEALEPWLEDLESSSISIPQYLQEEERLHRHGSSFEEKRFRSAKKNRPAFHLKHGLRVLRVKIDWTAPHRSTACFEVIDNPDHAFQNCSYDLDYLFGDRKRDRCLRFFQFCTWLSWLKPSNLIAGLPGYFLWVVATASFQLVNFYSTWTFKTSLSVKVFVLVSLFSLVARDWVEAVKSHDLEIFAFQLILLTAGGIITTLQDPWVLAKRLLTRLAKNLSSVWTKYLVSIGNSCLCGSYVKLGSFLHKCARPDLVQKINTTLLCDCGYEMFVDTRPAPASLSRVTNTPLSKAPVSTVTDHGIDQPSRIPPVHQRRHVVQEQSGVMPGQMSTSGSTLENSSTQGSSVLSEASASPVSTMMFREKGFLLMCVNTGKYMTKLSHIETTYLGNDYVLFSNIRASYEALRQAPLKFYSLYHPTSARLVRFELVPINQAGGSFVGGIRAPSLPPPELVTKGHYHYAPCPIETELDSFLPELGFWHQFYNPHTCAQLWWLTRLPTKLETQLQFNPGVQCLGWGIHLEETLNMFVITSLSFVITISSYFISILWSVIRKDVSGGFGMGSFLVSVGSLILAFVMMHRKGVI